MARATQRGPVTAKVCVLAKALRNTQFVKSAAPDPQQNQALRPSFPRAPGGEVSRDPIDVRSTVRHGTRLFYELLSFGEPCGRMGRGGWPAMRSLQQWMASLLAARRIFLSR